MLRALKIIGCIAWFALLYFPFHPMSLGCLFLAFCAREITHIGWAVTIYTGLVGWPLGLLIGYEAARLGGGGAGMGVTVGIVSVALAMLAEYDGIVSLVPLHVVILYEVIAALACTIGGYVHSKRAERRRQEPITHMSARSTNDSYIRVS